MDWSSNPRISNPKATFEETGAWNEGHWFSVKENIFEGATSFQDVRIIDTDEYGIMLILDGHTQSAQADEEIYHESLVHPGMLLHANPRKVLIIGGGEGATAREVLRHRTVEELTMVDLDGELVNLCKEHMTSWHRGAFDDPRMRLIIGDGLNFIANEPGSWDVIIMDVVDAYEDGPSEELFSTPFYRQVKNRLSPDGILIVQAMELSPTVPHDHLITRGHIVPVFGNVVSYSTFVPSFWSEWGFIIASDTLNLGNQSPIVIDKRIETRVAGPLVHIDGETVVRMRNLSKVVRDGIAGAE
jgi:spermidine synthase